MSNKFITKFLSLPRYLKSSLIIILDTNLCILSVWFAYFLRFDYFVQLRDLSFEPIVVATILFLSIFSIAGLYRIPIRYSNLNNILQLPLAFLIYGLIYFSIFTLYVVSGVPRSIGILQPVLLVLFLVISRIFIIFILEKKIFLFKKKFLKKILIYGAGAAGQQLLKELNNNNQFDVVGFLDDDKSLQNQTLLGRKIYSPSSLLDLINLKEIKLVLLSMPSISRNQKNVIIKKLSKYNLEIKSLPSVADIIKGKVTLNDIKELDADDILDREYVQPDEKLLVKNIKSKVILVTGAGGSIGFELCNQIAKLAPKKLILLELSEFNLYKIYNFLKNSKVHLKIIPIIANIQDETKIKKILKIFKVQTVYHAAAYKHVTLVEENISEGIKNNIFGTLILAKCALEKSVENFVMISSDKAVKPTNIMGASKRLAEICLQSLYDMKKNYVTKMCIVRFGNVLGSSGSIIPLFKSQIKNGGPITLTHNDVERYFMTISEASQLVIQAGALNKGCDIFVLDMGERVKIKDLIHRMVELSGLTIRNNENIDGDIEIKVIGLKPGEKLYEELSNNNNRKKTQHPKIYLVKDQFIRYEKLNIELEILKSYINIDDIKAIKDHLRKMLKNYEPTNKIIDHIFLESKKF